MNNIDFKPLKPVLDAKACNMAMRIVDNYVNYNPNRMEDRVIPPLQDSARYLQDLIIMELQDD